METGDDDVGGGQHRAGAVDVALQVFDVGFDAAQDTHAVHQARPHVHVHKVPVVRRIGHVRAVIGDGEQLDALLLGFGDVIVQRAVSVGAGDGVHMQINGVHCFSFQRAARKGTGRRDDDNSLSAT